MNAERQEKIQAKTLEVPFTSSEGDFNFCSLQLPSNLNEREGTLKTHKFTSESVSIGHPDKLADQISDNILDSHLKQDPDARVAVETFLAKGVAVVGGEVSSTAHPGIEEVVRSTIRDAGYTDSSYGMDAESIGVVSAITRQSPEIAAGVFHSKETRQGTAEDRFDSQGAGDQGLMFGYAVADNPDCYPSAGKLAHMLSQRLATVRKTGDSPLRPDSKTQVTLTYAGVKPVDIDTILISTQHDPQISQKQLQDFVTHEVIAPVVEEYNRVTHYPLLNQKNYIINPAGSWTVGGSFADAGLTGRKITVDTYAGYARHGGGAFSGKDPSKVDRSAAYYARYVAKNLVAAGVAEELELQVSYGIGQANPTSFLVDTRNRPAISVEKIESIIEELFDFRPLAMIDQLQLKTVQYRETAENGHFGRNPGDRFTWERLDKVDAILNLL